MMVGWVTREGGGIPGASSSLSQGFCDWRCPGMNMAAFALTHDYDYELYTVNMVTFCGPFYIAIVTYAELAG